MTRNITALLVAAVTSIVTIASHTLSTLAAAVPSSPAEAGTVIINEIKSGNSGLAGTTTPAEYVTLFNASDTAVSLDGWKLEFAKQSFPAANCDSPDWKAANPADSNMYALSGSLPARGISAPFPLVINNDTAGAVRLTDGGALQLDLAGWGMGLTAPPCAEDAPAPDLHSGKSLQRYLGCISHEPIDTDSNAADLYISSTPAPGLAGTIIAPQCPPGPDDTDGSGTEPDDNSEPVPDTDGSTGPGTPVAPDPIPACADIVISEVLPNPSGTDSGREFIELYNPTDEAITMDTCQLQTSASMTKTFSFAQTTLQPGEYKSFTDSQTGLSLPNASGGTVWLLAADGSEILEATYPGDLPDDVGWAIGDGIWGNTYTPTPNAANLITPTEPCPAGQVRSAETNRCVSTPTESAVGASAGTASVATPGLTPCKAGQERNPETNRCRNIASAGTTGNGPAACKAGQERNPETNRCRNIASATASKSATPCPAGQERNPDTNRCRKILASTAAKNGGGNIEDAATAAPAKNKPYGLIAAVILAAAICYAIYEWRQEIRQFFANRLPGKKPMLAYSRSRA